MDSIFWFEEKAPPLQEQGSGTNNILAGKGENNFLLASVIDEGTLEVANISRPSRA